MRQILLCVLVVLFCTACSGKRSEPAAASGDSIPVSGRIVFFDADPVLERGGLRVTVEIGTVLEEGDRLTAGADGSCEIYLEGLGSLMIAPASTLVLDGLRPTEQRGVVSLVKGSVTAKITRLANPDDFVIRGTLGVAGVRGTVFTVETDETGSFRVTVVEGSVSVFPDALITTGRHPAAELLGLVDHRTVTAESTVPVLAASELEQLPLVAAGESLSLEPGPLREVDSRLKAADAPHAMQAVDLIREVLTGKPGPVPEIKTSDVVPSVPSSTVTPSRQVPAAPVPAPQSAAPVAPVTPVQPVPVTRFQMKDYSIAYQAVSAPAATELPGSWIPRPRFPAPMPVDQRVIKPVTDATHSFNLSGLPPRIVKGSFPDGRAMIDIFEPVQESGALLLEPDQTINWKTGHYYELQFTAWSPRADSLIEVHFKEFGTDHTGDGNAWGVYHDTQPVQITRQPHRYRIMYYHRGPLDTTGAYSLLLGRARGTLYFQDFEVRELHDLGERDPWKSKLVNGSFDYGLAGWDPLMWTVSGETDPDKSCFRLEGGTLIYEWPRARSEYWLAQAVQWVGIERNREYEVEFDARLDGAGRFSVELLTFRGNIIPVSPVMFIEPVRGEWNRYVLRFKSTESAIQTRFQLNFGEISGKMQIDSVVLRPLP